ncbi:MAG: hypothetical protein RR051_07670, partial [Clostridiales bacterium]
TVVQAPKLVAIGIDNVTTSLSMPECVAMASALVKMDLANLEMYTVPGVGRYIPYGGQSISFWVASRGQLVPILKELTGDDTVNPHIIDDGGRGTAEPNRPNQDDDSEGDDILGGDPSLTPGTGTEPGAGTEPGMEPGTEPGTGGTIPIDPGVVNPVPPVDPGVVEPGNSNIGDSATTGQ